MGSETQYELVGPICESADVVARDRMLTPLEVGDLALAGTGFWLAGQTGYQDAAGKTQAAQPAEQVVFRVTDIVVPVLDMSSEEAKRDLEALNRGVSEDILAEYIARLESEIGLTINQSALNQVVSGGAGEGAD